VGIPALAAAAGLAWSTGGSAVTSCPGTLTFNCSGTILGDGPADVTIDFSIDNTNGELTITLTYNDIGGLAGLEQILAGVIFEAVGTGVSFAGTGTVTAEAFVGPEAGQASSDLGLDVSGHWGFKTVDLSAYSLSATSQVLSSVGDVFGGPGGFAPFFPPGGPTVGSMDIIDATVQSSVESMPPDGASFGIVDDTTCNPTCLNGFASMGAYIQNSAVAVLDYSGTIDSIENVVPIFGTEGMPIPEPAAGGLLTLGLLGLLWKARRAA
jgi:hypothetical protein